MKTEGSSSTSTNTPTQTPILSESTRKTTSKHDTSSSKQDGVTTGKQKHVTDDITKFNAETTKQNGITSKQDPTTSKLSDTTTTTHNDVTTTKHHDITTRNDKIQTNQDHPLTTSKPNDSIRTKQNNIASTQHDITSTNHDSTTQKQDDIVRKHDDTTTTKSTEKKSEDIANPQNNDVTISTNAGTMKTNQNDVKTTEKVKVKEQDETTKPTDAITKKVHEATTHYNDNQKSSSFQGGSKPASVTDKEPVSVRNQDSAISQKPDKHFHDKITAKTTQQEGSQGDQSSTAKQDGGQTQATTDTVRHSNVQHDVTSIKPIEDRTVQANKTSAKENSDQTSNHKETTTSKYEDASTTTKQTVTKSEPTTEKHESIHFENHGETITTNNVQITTTKNDTSIANSTTKKDTPTSTPIITTKSTTVIQKSATTSSTDAEPSSAKTRTTTHNTKSSYGTSGTAKPRIKQNHVLYPVSSDYHFPDLKLNGTCMPKSAEAVEIIRGPFGFGPGISTNEGNCIRNNNYSRQYDEACLKSPGDCPKGISMSVWERITLYRDGPPRYIMSTGGDETGNPGISVYHQGIELYAIVSDGLNIWKLGVLGPVANNSWTNVGILWDAKQGLEMYVDSEKVGSVLYPTDHTKQAKPPRPKAEVAVGCQIKEDGTYGDFSAADLDELAIWMRRLPENQTHYFLGGYDQSGNFNLTELKIILLKDGINLDDPELYSQVADILRKWSQKGSDFPDFPPEEEEPDTSIEIVDDLTPTSTRRSRHTTATRDSSQPPYRSPKAKGRPVNQSDEVIQTNNMLVDDITNILMEKMVTVFGKTSLTEESLRAYAEMLETVSNRFRPENEKNWRRIHEDYKGAPIIVDKLSAWGLDLLKRVKLRKRQTDFYHSKATDNIVMLQDRKSLKDMKKFDKIAYPDYGDKSWDSVRWSSGNRFDEGQDKCEFSPKMFDKTVENKTDGNYYFAMLIYNTYSSVAPLRVGRRLPNKRIFLDSKAMSIGFSPMEVLNDAIHNGVKGFLFTFAHKKPETAITSRKLLFHNPDRTIPSVKRRYCVYWDTTVPPNGSWTRANCEMGFTSDTFSMCQCSQPGTYAILAQKMLRREMKPDALWLMFTKYTCYAISFLLLIIYIGTILLSKFLKEQFHIIRLNMSVAALIALSSMLASDYVREDRHWCTALAALMHYFYIAVALWICAEAHGVFAGVVRGIVGGRVYAYFLLCWGIPFIFLGVAFVTRMEDYGFETRCMVSWDDDVKWLMFGPILFSALLGAIFVYTALLNLSFSPSKKELFLEDISSVAKGLGMLVTMFDMTWIFACLAYLDIELVEPDYYPIFQVLNSWLGIGIFVFMGLGSKRFRTVMRGQVPEDTKFPIHGPPPDHLSRPSMVYDMKKQSLEPIEETAVQDMEKSFRPEKRKIVAA